MNMGVIPGNEEAMKKILVTGCNGQLGRAINKVYQNDEVTFVNTDVVEGDGVERGQV